MKKNIYKIVSTFLINISILGAYLSNYLGNHFKDTTIGILITHLRLPLIGSNLDFLQDELLNFVIVIVFANILIVCILIEAKRKNNINLIERILLGVSVFAFFISLFAINYRLKVIQYLDNYIHKSLIYEQYYVSPNSVEVTFENTRNLIFIVMESMETSLADSESGGLLNYNIIPNLTEIAVSNTTFSDSNVLNGFYEISGADFTVGSLISMTSGVPISHYCFGRTSTATTWDSGLDYVPGAISIGEILESEGYNQEIIIGSEAEFAGRRAYFSNHGNYTIFDYNTAIEKGIISPDYYVYWGFEDELLFECAKTEIEDLAKNKEPFNATILTVDTHYPDGYICNRCENRYIEKYSNAYSCSDSQVSEFISWIMEQDFYENTTIVLCGDHLTMSSDYPTTIGTYGRERKVFCTFINSARDFESENETRLFTALDIYPTTLAAIGAEIERDRLGLGTNLYSHQKTLCEIYGIENLNKELSRRSVYYEESLISAK